MQRDSRNCSNPEISVSCEHGISSPRKLVCTYLVSGTTIQVPLHSLWKHIQKIHCERIHSTRGDSTSIRSSDFIVCCGMGALSGRLRDMVFGAVAAMKTQTKIPNEPVDLIPVPSGLSAYLLLIPLRGQEECRKQAGIGHWGRSVKNICVF